MFRFVDSHGRLPAAARPHVGIAPLHGYCLGGATGLANHLERSGLALVRQEVGTGLHCRRLGRPNPQQHEER